MHKLIGYDKMQIKLNVQFQSPNDDEMIQCYFDWCGSNGTAVSGVVSAGRGQCQGTDVTQGHVKAYR